MLSRVDSCSTRVSRPKDPQSYSSPCPEHLSTSALSSTPLPSTERPVTSAIDPIVRGVPGSAAGPRRRRAAPPPAPPPAPSPARPAAGANQTQTESIYPEREPIKLRRRAYTRSGNRIRERQEASTRLGGRSREARERLYLRVGASAQVGGLRLQRRPLRPQPLRLRLRCRQLGARLRQLAVRAAVGRVQLAGRRLQLRLHRQIFDAFFKFSA
eukprot:8279383-Pyramimonas_sp.AAC.1